MIQFTTESKGKSRGKAVLKTLQANQNFNSVPDKKGFVQVLVPCQLFEDQECRDSGLHNALEQRNYTIDLSKKDLDLINSIYYKALMKCEEFKDSIKV